MTAIQAAFSPRTAIYRQAGHIIDEMDDLALLITGKRDYSRNKSHSTP